MFFRESDKKEEKIFQSLFVFILFVTENERKIPRKTGERSDVFIQ